MVSLILYYVGQGILVFLLMAVVMDILKPLDWLWPTRGKDKRRIRWDDVVLTGIFFVGAAIIKYWGW